MGIKPELINRQTSGAGIDYYPPDIWRLSIPSGQAGKYRWSQLDDYLHLERRKFLWRAPVKVSLRARVSGQNLMGTWGFGLWNDPFSVSMGINGMGKRLPALPNTCWFFYASPPNYLALYDNHPAVGMLSATFSAPRIPSPILGIGLPFLPLLIIPAVARIFRKIGRMIIRENANALNIELSEWHDYVIGWKKDEVVFSLDGRIVHQTYVSPRGPLGLVIWIDNQFAAFHPTGKVNSGTLENREPAWLEVAGVDIDT